MIPTSKGVMRGMWLFNTENSPSIPGNITCFNSSSYLIPSGTKTLIFNFSAISTPFIFYLFFLFFIAFFLIFILFLLFIFLIFFFLFLLLIFLIFFFLFLFLVRFFFFFIFRITFYFFSFFTAFFFIPTILKT